jgi:hypothetical protein
MVELGDPATPPNPAIEDVALAEHATEGVEGILRRQYKMKSASIERNEIVSILRLFGEMLSLDEVAIAYLYQRSLNLAPSDVGAHAEVRRWVAVATTAERRGRIRPGGGLELLRHRTRVLSRRN